MSLPSTTVVIPCFNHGRFVAEAVRSCLAQEQADVRVIIVDDGSDDGATPAACDACAAQSPGRVVVVHQENNGLAAARNIGAAKARRLGGEWLGDYLTFLDADDWIEPTFVTRLHAAIVPSRCSVRVMAAGTEPHAEARGPWVPPLSERGASAGNEPRAQARGAATAEANPIRTPPPDDSTDHPDGPNPSRESKWSPESGISHAYCQERLVELHQMVWAVPEWDPLLMMVTNLHPVTTLIRRECFEAVGGFDESMREGYEDWDLWLKFVARGWAGVRVREPLFIWRRHSQNTMIVQAAKHHEHLFSQLMANHAGLYQKHAAELLLLSNRLLRQGDANWLDESGEAIVVRDTRKQVQTLIAERDAARNETVVQRQSLLQAAETLKLAVEQERQQQTARLSELTGQIDAFAREQVTLLGSIGTLTRERIEARDDHQQASAALGQTTLELGQALASYELTTRERDQARASHELAIQERDHARASYELSVRERDQARAEVHTTQAERDATREALEAERVASHAARAETEATQARLIQAQAAHAADIAATIAAYEAKPVVRFSRAMHRALDRLPGPLSRLIKGAARGVARIVGGGRR